MLHSHFHSDHYRGLNANFDHGIIVCSPATGNLVSTVLRVREEYIRRIPLEEWNDIDGVQVMLIDAFHCPGSVVFIIRLPDGRSLFHTGDFRASREFLQNPIFARLGPLHFEAVYLDTTYGNPQYAFPSQRETIDLCCRTIDRLVHKQDQKAFSPIRRLILVGSYLIGKEKIALAVAKQLSSKIYCSSRKLDIFRCLDWPEFQERLTDEASEALIHIVSMSELDARCIGLMLDGLWPKYSHALAIRPTGWTFDASNQNANGALTFHDHIRKDALGQTVKRKDAIAIMALPYSEHSSFAELVDLFQMEWMKCKMVIPTVDNPFDLYMEQDDHDDARQMLLAWSQRKTKDR